MLHLLAQASIALQAGCFVDCLADAKHQNRLTRTGGQKVNVSNEIASRLVASCISWYVCHWQLRHLSNGKVAAMGIASPTCYVIAGPNGAGKTTFAMRYLPRVAHCVEFVNADSIARGLSPLNEAAVQMHAGRLFLKRLQELRQRRVSLAFETTLSGRGHVKVLREFRSFGYRIELNYLWIPSAEFSVRRVASRVANGGHDIPAEALARRYAKSMQNLRVLYLPLADYVAVWDNSSEKPRRIYERDEDGEALLDEAIWGKITECGA